MKATKILNEQIKDLKVASLPSRPTAPTSFGGRGYTASQMKDAFDKLPLYIIERFNELLEDISGIGEDSLSAAIPTGIEEGHSLAELFSDIKSGVLASYMTVGDQALTDYKVKLDLALLKISEDIENIFAVLATKTIDCGTPAQRGEQI